jgi:hypothetical protein
VARRRKPIPPAKVPAQQAPGGIYELDRFSEASLSKWAELSGDLDELQAVLHFNVEPERRRLRPELITALQRVAPVELPLEGWVRIVTYQFSLAPLSCAGSLLSVGGRFNAGFELDPGTLSPWPALYLAEDFETAFREKFQLERTALVDGLTPQELALEQGISHSTVRLRGHLHRVFDMTRVESLVPVAEVFRKIKMPTRARQLKKKLGIANSGLSMAQTAQQVYNMVLLHNWRVLPVQFGLPAQSHVLSELIRAAGFEAIFYRSTKGAKNCLAVFPDLIDSGSFVELMDASPPGVKHRRLDASTAAELEGWEALLPRYHPK